MTVEENTTQPEEQAQPEPDVQVQPDGRDEGDAEAIAFISKAVAEAEPQEDGEVHPDADDPKPEPDEKPEATPPPIDEALVQSAKDAGLDEDEIAAFTPAQLKAVVKVLGKKAEALPPLPDAAPTITDEQLAKIREDFGPEVADVLKAQSQEIAALRAERAEIVQAENQRKAQEVGLQIERLFETVEEELKPVVGDAKNLTPDQQESRKRIISRMAEINSANPGKYSIPELFREAAYGPLAGKLVEAERRKFAQAAKRNASAATIRPSGSSRRLPTHDPEAASLSYIKEKIAGA